MTANPRYKNDFFSLFTYLWGGKKANEGKKEQNQFTV